MRTALIALLVLAVSVGYGYYQQNPDDRAKLVAQATELLHGIIPSSVAGTNPATPNSQSAASDPSSASPSSDGAAPAPAPGKTWTPPSVLPAQPNWIWTTNDGKTYENVVITSVNPAMVSITHSVGVAHLPISTLPATIQRQLNYDPDLAASFEAASATESKRQEDHPYYSFDSLADAQAAARQAHLPLAWISSKLDDLSVANPEPGSEADLTQMAMHYLRSRAVIIFLNVDFNLGLLSPVVRDQQFFQYDDANVPPPHHYYPPKIAFTDPDITKALGRVSCTQMQADGQNAIAHVLGNISEK